MAKFTAVELAMFVNNLVRKNVARYEHRAEEKEYN
jgi:hypothetical protein